MAFDRQGHETLEVSIVASTAPDQAFAVSEGALVDGGYAQDVEIIPEQNDAAPAGLFHV
jgi:hypothetical protein